VRSLPEDKSNGYEEVADRFMSARNPVIGRATVSEWCRILPQHASVLDLGCGHGVPVSQTLIEQGFTVFGVDASPTLLAAFRRRFPGVSTDCSAVEDSGFFERGFDGVVAWGLLFLLPPHVQSLVVHKVARALKPGGKFLFTSPKERTTWRDALTGRESISLGAERYQQLLDSAGLNAVGELYDEGNNHYYLVAKPPGTGPS